MNYKEAKKILIIHNSQFIMILHIHTAINLNNLT